MRHLSKRVGLQTLSEALLHLNDLGRTAHVTFSTKQFVKNNARRVILDHEITQWGNEGAAFHRVEYMPGICHW